MHYVSISTSCFDFIVFIHTGSMLPIHVLKCKVILKMLNKEENNTPLYEKILDGSGNEKLVIAKQFSKNLKIIGTSWG